MMSPTTCKPPVIRTGQGVGFLSDADVAPDMQSDIGD